MAEFSASVYQNEFLPAGGTDVNAIVTLSCVGAGAAGQSGGGDAGEIVIVDAEADPESPKGEDMIVFRSVEGFEPPTVELAEAGPTD